MKRIIIAILAGIALVTPLAVTAAPAQAAQSQCANVTFKAWGTPIVAEVGIMGVTSIDAQRRLPFSQRQYLCGIDLDWAMMHVDDTRGYRNVGCAIYVNGRLRAQDLSSFGYALCMA